MFKIQYFLKIIKEHAALLIFAILFSGGFQILLLGVFSTSEILNFLDAFVKKFPPQVQQLMGETFIGQFSVSGIAAFGYSHPFVLILFSIVAIILPEKHIGMELENGTLELLFALPVKRMAIAVTLWLTSVVTIFILTVGCWIGTWWGLHINSGPVVFPLSKIFLIGINLWLLMLAVNGVTFLMAAFSRLGSKVALQAAGLMLFFYFLNYAIKIWPAIKFLQHFTLFNYYQPQTLIFDQSDLTTNLLVLAAISISSVAMAFRKLQIRDIH